LSPAAAEAARGQAAADQAALAAEETARLAHKEAAEALELAEASGDGLLGLQAKQKAAEADFEVEQSKRVRRSLMDAQLCRDLSYDMEARWWFAVVVMG
jgi:hypothetical protein